MRLLLLLPLLFLLAACETPLEPSSIGDSPLTITNIINIGGDDDHSGDNKGDDVDDDDDSEVSNSPPFILSPGTQENDVGDNVALVLTASDADGDTLTWQWEANSQPRNLTLQSTGPTSAIISGVISSSSAEDSPFTTRLFVSDGQAESSVVFLWIVNAPPEV